MSVVSATLQCFCSVAVLSSPFSRQRTPRRPREVLPRHRGCISGLRVLHKTGSWTRGTRERSPLATWSQPPVTLILPCYCPGTAMRARAYLKHESCLQAVLALHSPFPSRLHKSHLVSQFSLVRDFTFYPPAAMFFSSSIFLLAAAASVQAAIFDVQVGSFNGTTAFTPDVIPSAQIGDQVVFTFQQKNHSATQSTFAAPCTHMAGGFDSGFHPVAANQTDNFPTFTVTVNNSSPVWVFCDQDANTPASHCGAGMVFAINPGPDGSNNSFTDFQNTALAIGKQLQAEGSSTANSLPASLTTAAYGTATIPAAPLESLVTVTVTVEASTWTTVYSSYPGSPAATPASLTGNVHVVQVGFNGTLAYDPPFVIAEPRDTVQFLFNPKNHTVTQSSFAAPCVPMLDSDGTPTVDSGFMPVAANATDFPSFNITVNTTDPTWFYCKQHNADGSSHCGDGMVFAINPVQNSTRNFTAFQQLAEALNGTNATGLTVNSTSSSSPSPSSKPNGAISSVGVNLALGLGAISAIFAAML